jgi:hypothetical protein
MEDAYQPSSHKTIESLVIECRGTLFKHSKLSNYYLKMLNFLIPNALIAQTFIKNYYLRSLPSPGAIVKIFQRSNTTFGTFSFDIIPKLVL